MYEKTDYGPGAVAASIYSIGSAVAFAIVYVASKDPFPVDLPVPPIVAAAGLGLVLLLISAATGGSFAKQHKRANQLERDRRSQLILEQARQRQAGLYTLYLRGFSTTGQMPAEDTSTIVQPGFDPRGIEGAIIDLEAVIAQVLESEAPVVALGRPGEQMGAEKVRTEDDCWKNDLRILADNALLLVIIPSPGKGIEWEIEWVRSCGHLDKTLFLMPPKVRSLPVWPRSSLSWSETWSVLRIRLNELGFSLPAYDDQGMIFLMREDGSISKGLFLGGWLHPMWIKGRITHLLDEMTRNIGERKPRSSGDVSRSSSRRPW